MKKRFDHMTREEYRRKKRGAVGGNYSDEYDDEDDNDSWWEDSDYENKVDRSGKVIPGNESQETELGKKGSDGKLVRPPGISDKEWKKMNREQ